MLHLEDSDLDARLIEATLTADGLRCEIVHVANRVTFEAAILQRNYDIILCDYGIPGYDGFSALEYAKSACPRVPVVMISGLLDENQAVESLRKGAADYVFKQRLVRLGPSVRRALQESEDRERREINEERIRAQAELLNIAHDAIVVRMMDDRIVFWNKGAAAVFGWSQEEASGREFASLLRYDTRAAQMALQTTLGTGDWVGEMRLRDKFDKDIFVFSHWTLWRSQSGEPLAIFSASTDVTQKKQMEIAALRSQRMESLGVLAGGIAHDLNNALAPVLLCADLLKGSDEPAVRQRLLEMIETGAWRATSMVKQILGFARGSSGKPEPLDIGDLVREMAKIVRETFPKSILVHVEEIGQGLRWIKGDSTSLHQVILNLCVNARDAMPDGGRISLTVMNVDWDQDQARRLQAKSGPHVMLSVRDTGVGIPPDIRPHIFEPFFTTKTADLGTGLGLSTVARIVKQHNGVIEIFSDVGRGTDFRLYLPATEKPTVAAEKKATGGVPSGHGETILIIDDEEAIRELAKVTLENNGYAVLLAQNGVQGVAVFENHIDEIRLVLTDNDMPMMDGPSAILAIKRMRSDIPVILASGATGDQGGLSSAEGVFALGKPYNLEQLLEAVSSALTH